MATSKSTPVTNSLRKMSAPPKASAVPESKDGTTNEILKNITLFWVKLDKPVDNYAGDGTQYEVQARVPKKRAAELMVYGKVKEQDDGTVSINFRKNATKADGTAAAKVVCVDAAKEPLDPRVVGNGSVGNIKLMRKPYEIRHPKTGKVTKEGISTALSAIQVTKLVKYEGGKGGNLAGFDVEGESFGEAPEDDDIPF